MYGSGSLKKFLESQNSLLTSGSGSAKLLERCLEEQRQARVCTL